MPIDEHTAIEQYMAQRDKEREEAIAKVKPTKKYLLKLFLRSKLEQGYSPIVVITGHTRGGKTCMALKLAEDIDNDFDFKTSYYSEVTNFIMNIQNLKGRVCIIDEVGYQLSAMQWWTKINKVMNYILQTQGLRNVCYIFVLPHLEYLAKHIRRMLDVVGEMKNKGIMRVYFVQTFHSKLEGKKTYLYNVETLVNVPLPKCFDEFKEVEKGFKLDILKELQEDILLHQQQEQHDKAILKAKINMGIGNVDLTGLEDL